MYIQKSGLHFLLWMTFFVCGMSSVHAANVLYSDVQTIFTTKCIGCHGGAGGLSLTSPGSYNNLVLVTSVANSSQFRVKPFDSANSNLAVKVSAGGSMNGFLSAADITTITNWINQGASTSYTVIPSSNSVVAGSGVTVTAQLKDMNNTNLNLSGVTAAWSHTGGGSFSAPTSNTSASGLATITFTTGVSAGVNQIVTATTSATTGTSGNIATTPGPAVKYKVSSSSATAQPGTSVMITAQLVDANNNPVATAGLTVIWNSTNGGSFTAPTSQTNASGIATMNFTVSAAVATIHTVTATDNTGITGTSANIKVTAQGAIDLVSSKPDGSVSVALTSHFSNSPGALSTDGRFMVFISDATTLTGDADTNGTFDAYVRDLSTGVTSLVTINASGTAASDAGVSQTSPAVISGNGRFVTFSSTSTNLVSPAPTAHMHVYRRDLQTNTTVLVSTDSSGIAGNADSDAPVISDDGRYIAFTSLATNLTAIADANGGNDIFLHDCQANTTQLVSVKAAGTAAGNGASTLPVINSDGHFVAFASNASDLVAGDANASSDVFRRDMQTNGLSSTVIVSGLTGSSTAGNGASSNPQINSTGQFVTFESASTNLIAGDVNGLRDIFRRDCSTNSTVCVSAINGSATPGAGFADSGPAPMSADGRYVVFTSSKTNLISNDTNNSNDVFRRDCNTNTTIIISALNNTGTVSQTGNSKNGQMSSDGRFVAFESSCNDLTAAAYLAGYQVYRRDTITNATLLLSTSLTGTTGNADSQYLSMSSDGTRAGFSSYSNNLVTVNTAFNLNVFAVSVDSAPQVAPIPSATTNEGTTFTQNGTFNDINSLDTFLATVDYGDGTGLQTLALTGNTFTLSHIFADNGIYSVNVAVTDNHGATGNASQIVTVLNVAPTVSIQNAPPSGVIGLAVSLSAAITDPGKVDTFAYAWSVTKDGAAYAAGTSAAYSFTPDAAAAYVVSLTVTDKDGGSGSATVSLDVIKPNGFAGALTTITDSNPAAGAVSYQWDFGDGSLKVMTTSPTVDHVYAAPGTYTVTVTETDANGIATTKTFTVTVGGAISTLDNDGDGFPDELEKGVGSSPIDPNSTPFNIAGPVTPIALATSLKSSIKLSFVKTGNDSIALSGTLPFAPGFAFNGTGVAIDVGGAIQAFTLDSKGGAKIGKSSFKASIVKGKISAKFTAKLNGSYAGALADEGVDANKNVKSSMRTITVYIIFAQALYRATPNLKYSAKAGISANAKN
jgi:hypothetical protein